MKEPLPLAVVHDAILEFLRERDDVVLYGAHAVNAYVDEPRMTQDVDVMSTRGEAFAEELRAFLHDRFHIAARVRTVRKGLGYRIYQMRKPKNRDLADVRPVDELPPHQRVDGVAVETPPVLIADKLRSMVARSKKPKGKIDEADALKLLVAFPELKTEEGPVAGRLRELGAEERVLEAWWEMVAGEIEPDDEGFDW